MRDTRTSELVESIVQISRQKNGDDLRLSLLKTVMEALDANTTRFLRHVRARGGQVWVEDFQALRSPSSLNGYELKLFSSATVELSEPMRHCVETTLPLQSAGADGSPLYIHPVMDGGVVHELIVVEVARHNDNDFRLTKAIVQLYQNYLDLVRATERDTLTGLLNRRSLETSVSRLMYSAARHSSRRGPEGQRPPQHGGRYWLAVIDIDHFKRVNDSFGHLFGDEVLLLVARVMQQCFRTDDLLFRYGGEEFIVILEAETLIEAQAALERYRRQVSSYRFPQLEQVTVSIGFVELKPEVLMSDAVGHADQALYHAKAHGRNQVCDYAQLVKQHEAPTALLNSAAELF
ncbi:MAG: GGDEF domain-containing protein [Nevskiaceae bacterium]|nr:MAG: GGDEF domain-containing protein [Nevskiaceae bacterium]TAM26739.1 MAG: GGDEF domain-containing protein [Nevskiaceae bacterium]